ncbi:MAG: hypothetical protein B6D36_17055 [Planctomycetes bacterium UTPLA1]|jgi:hypothetical protein|nr:MAG: hypothetical protein B6D36_17055 [Planctomycetes bacterium UTPLA1]
MSANSTIIIEATNVSLAWSHAFLHAMHTTLRDIRPIVLTIGGFDPPLPPEDSNIRTLVDNALVRADKYRTQVSAMTIFPFTMWLRRSKPSCAEFSSLCIDRLIPRLKRRDRHNQYGTYFERMMAFRGTRNSVERVVNQIQHVIELLKSRRRRPRQSALQVACFDPAKDHTRQPVRGFPCLQQVAFAYDANGGLCVSAFYPTQYIFDRAYGNYLGLCHLGYFVAHETGLTLRQMTCFIGRPLLGTVSKSTLRPLQRKIELHLRTVASREEPS